MKPHYRITLIYLIVGFLWIFFSDNLVHNLFFFDNDTMTMAQHLKGFFFVAFTGTLLFFLIRRDFNRLIRAKERLIESYNQTMQGWIRVMDMRHKETKDHTRRVTEMTLSLAKRFGITDYKELENMERGCLLHDMGKIGIPDSILLKSGKLTSEEWKQMKKHPEIAYEIMKKIDFLIPSIDIPYCHHEKWDGTGYPRGLRRENIPLHARIFAIVDVWDALTNTRLYKPAWDEDRVLQLFRQEAGHHFDPEVVELFIRHYEDLKREVAISNRREWEDNNE